MVERSHAIASDGGEVGSGANQQPDQSEIAVLCRVAEGIGDPLFVVGKLYAQPDEAGRGYCELLTA